MGIRSHGFRVEPGMTEIFQISQFALNPNFAVESMSDVSMLGVQRGLAKM